MKVRTILYHDVVDGDFDSSGFPGAAAARYKLTRAEFDAHLDRMAQTLTSRPTTFRALAQETDAVPFLITFA